MLLILVYSDRHTECCRGCLQKFHLQQLHHHHHHFTLFKPSWLAMIATTPSFDDATNAGQQHDALDYFHTTQAAFSILAEAQLSHAAPLKALSQFKRVWTMCMQLTYRPSSQYSETTGTGTLFQIMPECAIWLRWRPGSTCMTAELRLVSLKRHQ